VTQPQIVSTSQLTPDGILGYAKSIAALLSAVLISVAAFLPDNWQRWVQATIAVLGVIAVYAVPNKIAPTPPAPIEPPPA
jgi:hypothetical protein